MKKLMIVAIVSILLIEMGCKKNTDPIPTPQIPSQLDDDVSCLQNKIYFPLTKGSYWVYEENYYDSTTNNRSFASQDSCFILGRDSIVNGKRYAIMATITTNNSGTHGPYYILYRYVGDYILANTDQDYKIFSYCTTDEIIYTNTSENALWSSEFRILDKDSNLTVPAGTFETRSSENKYTRTVVNENDPEDMYRINSIYYGKNVGMVYNLCPFTSNPNQFLEKRLLRYSISNN